MQSSQHEDAGSAWAQMEAQLLPGRGPILAGTLSQEQSIPNHWPAAEGLTGLLRMPELGVEGCQGWPVPLAAPRRPHPACAGPGAGLRCLAWAWELAKGEVEHKRHRQEEGWGGVQAWGWLVQAAVAQHHGRALCNATGHGLHCVGLQVPSLPQALPSACQDCSAWAEHRSSLCAHKRCLPQQSVRVRIVGLRRPVDHSSVLTGPGILLADFGDPCRRRAQRRGLPVLQGTHSGSTLSQRCLQN